MTVTHSQIPARLKRQRGVATILVISSLLVLTLIGFALITIVQFQKMSATAAGSAQSRSNNIDLVTKSITDKLQQDLAQTYSILKNTGVKVDLSTEKEIVPNTYSANEMTYPGAAHKWLSSLVPYDSNLTTDADGDGDPTNDFESWRQISFLGTTPSTEFIDISTGLLYTVPAVPTQWDLPYKTTAALSAAEALQMVDTDGDGVVDSRYMLLKTPQSDDLLWAYAVRIVDNSGMLNLNTIANSYGASSALDVPTGQTPSDICLYYPMSAADGVVGTWGAGYAFTPTNFLPTTTQGATNWLAFYNAKGVAAVPNTPATRLTYWQNFAGKQNQAFHIYPNSGTLAGATPVGFADEVELRLKAGTNLSARSFLENTLDNSGVTSPSKNDSGMFRSTFPETNTIVPTTAQLLLRNRLDARRLFTAFNGTHAVSVPATLLSEYGGSVPTSREPMPAWLSEINSNITVPANPAGIITGVPWFKLNPNNDSPNRLAYLFENLLTQNTYLYARYSVTGTSTDYPAAVDTANMLAANLARYRLTNAGISYNVGDSQTYDPTQAQVVSSGGITYYGLAPQPFFTAIAYGEVYKEPGDDGKLNSASDIPSATTAPVKKLIAVELRNPWPVPIDLSQFALKYNGATINLVGSTRYLPPGDFVVVASDDPQWLSGFTTTVPSAHRIALSMTGSYLTAFPPTSALGNGVFELVNTAAPTVVIDRFQKDSPASTTWMRPNFIVPGAYPFDLPTGGIYNYFMSCATLQRWWDYDAANLPTSSNTAGNGYAQSYMLENPAGNSTARHLASNTYGEWRLANAATLGAYTLDGDVTSIFTANLGNIDPNDINQPVEKVGAAPATPGFTWPAWQISYPYFYSGTAGASTVGSALVTVGEVLNITTVSHTATDPFSVNLFNRYNNYTNPSLGNQPPILNYGQFQNGKFYDGAAYTLQQYRVAAPFIPLALTIPAALDIVTSNTNQPFIAGRLNVNTASNEALEALPYLYKNTPSTGLGLPTPYLGSRGITAYRDLATLASNTPAGPNYSSRATAISMPNIRPETGLALPSELLLVRSSTATDLNYTLNAPALDLTSTPAGATESYLDQVINDTEEDSLLYTKLSNVVTTRSDVFTAYVVLKGQKYDKTSASYKNLTTIRYVMTLLRGTVLASGIDGNFTAGADANGIYTFTFLSAAMPAGYDAGWLNGKDILLRRRSDPLTANSPTYTLAGKINSISNGGTITAKLTIADGAYKTLVTTFPSPDWEFQIVDNPKVLSFTQARQ